MVCELGGQVAGPACFCLVSHAATQESAHDAQIFTMMNNNNRRNDYY
jgi:hypothetical protein